MDFYHTPVSTTSIELARQVLLSGRLSEGKMVRRFEAALSTSLSIKHPVAVNSGSSALHLALVLANIQSGDEVILPAQTFIATGMTILMQGAIPVFADIKLVSGNIDPESVRSKITSKTKAIMAVHWGGEPCDMEELQAIADQYKLTLIEDAAHALGATYKNRPIGTISDFTAFSFQAIKHMTTADGGALCCKSDEIYQRAKKLRWFGIDRARSEVTILGEREYDIAEVGYKYHMNDLAAAVGLGNLVDFPRHLQRRRQIADFYRYELKNVKGLQLLEARSDRQSASWLFTILVEQRIEFIKKLKDDGVPTTVVNLRIDHNSVFGGIKPALSNQEQFNEQQIALPLHSDLTEEDVERVVRSIKSGW